jgi:hypothetical protein
MLNISATSGYDWFSQLRCIHHLAIAYTAVTFATDASITGVMCHILWNYRNEYAQ